VRLQAKALADLAREIRRLTERDLSIVFRMHALNGCTY
jgi:hypothetical protein